MSRAKKTAKKADVSDDEEGPEDLNMLIYTTANRNDAYRGAESILEEYGEINASPAPALTTAGHGHPHPTRRRATPQCHVGTSSSDAGGECVVTRTVSVNKYQHRQG
jgi:hypothetical protein